MHDAVQGGPFLVVAEGDRRQGGTVQRALGQQDPVPERLDQLGEPLGSRLDHLTCDDVTVDDDAAQIAECGRHC